MVSLFSYQCYRSHHRHAKAQNEIARKSFITDKQGIVPFIYGLFQGFSKTLLILPIKIEKMGRRENQSHFSIYLSEQRTACETEQSESTKPTPNTEEKKLYFA